MTKTYPYTIEDEENDMTADVMLEYTEEYDGIGPYEFWGAKCYDRGHLVINDIRLESKKDIHVIRNDEERIANEEDIKLIEEWIRKNFGRLAERISGGIYY